MRIFKTRNLVPKRVDLLRAVFRNLFNRRRNVDLFALLEDFNLKLFSHEIGNDLAFPGVVGVKNLIRLIGIDFFTRKSDNVGNRFSCLAVVKPPRDFNAGKCDFSLRFR